MYKRREVIKIIRRELESGQLLGRAISKTPVKTYQTIQNWREKPVSFSRFWHLRCDKLLTLAQAKCENKRVDAVEDKQFERLIKGEASPVEYIFYLCNRRPERWKRYDREVLIDQSQHTKILVIEQLQQKSDDEIIGTFRKFVSE